MFTNTVYFSEAARDFRNNNGIYCKAPRFSKEYRDYWAIQFDRCKNGYSVGGTWITGRHYFYLNFFPIYKVPDKIAIDIYKNGKLAKTADKTIDFPRFWEIDYEWFRAKHLAWNGGEWNNIKCDGGKHLCCGKTRGAGFSYKQASDGVYNYFFILGSKSYFFAASKNFLEGDGIMFKVRAGINFINQNVLALKLNSQKRNTMSHIRASYVDSYGEERGYFSEIFGIVVDDPNKTRGIRGREISFEEAGSFPNLKKAIEISMASVRDGSIYVGQIIVFGTSSSDAGASIEGLEDIFYSPDAYDMLAFNNIWEEDSALDKIGFFVPCYKADNTSIDANGNCDIPLALKKDEEDRQKKLLSKDYKQIDRRKAEYPRYPSEMFNRVVNNIFPIDHIEKQIKRINSDFEIKNKIRYGILERSNHQDSINNIRFIIGSKEQMKPIIHYPHNNNDYLDGCITIYEPPYQGKDKKTPDSMYVVVFDSYSIDEVEDKTSLFACYVLKLINNYDIDYINLPVASFIGRPKHLTTCYDNLFMLSDYYNASIQGEIAGGGQGVIDYAKQNRLLHKIEFEPEMLGNKETTRSRNKSYLMAMPLERKNLGLSYLSNWLIEDRGINENGIPIKNLDKIYDVGLLTEMKKFNPKGNFDRISSLIVGMFMLKNYTISQARVSNNILKSNYWNKPLFNGSMQDEFLTDY